MPFAMLFPGQGSQSVGMLDEMSSEWPVIRETFDEASEALGYDLWKVVSDGPADELDRTQVTQPAMLTAGYATWRAWSETLGGPDPAIMAGHSLGEYTALVCAGALQFSDAVRLVDMRGKFMQSAVAEGEGGMAAIIGLDDEQVISVCESAANGEVLEAVNFNAPGQVVIAGHREAVERGIEAASEAGARRSMMIPVSVPAHTSLMKAASGRLAQHLHETPIRKPNVPVLHNIDAQPRDDADELRRALEAQLSSPVRWVDTIQTLKQRGVDQCIECGPGKVLSGLVRRIDRDIKALPTATPKALLAALDTVVEGKAA